MATATTQNKTLTQGQNFTDTAGRTGVVNFDTATGKPLATGATTLATPNVSAIPVDSLATTPTPVVVPPPSTNSGNAALKGTMESILTQRQAENKKNAEDAANTLKTSQSDIVQNMLDIAGASSKVDRTAENAARVKYDNFTSQLEQEDLANRRATEAIQNDPGIATAEQRNAEIADITRKSLSKQADIAILQSAANRDYTTAHAIAEQDLQNRLEPLKAALEARKFIYENNKDLFDKADAKRLKDEEREYEKYAQDQKDITGLKLTLAKNGAPANVLTGLTQAKDLNEALNDPTITQYFTSPADKLDLELKREQILNAKADRANTYSLINDRAATAAGTGKPPTDTQVQSAGYATRIAQANQIIDANADAFKNLNYAQFKLIESNSQLANSLLTPEQRQVGQAMRNFITAKLRKESGASISPSEFADARIQYFPALKDDPKTLENKKRLRDSVLANQIQGAGSAYSAADTYLDTQVIPAMSKAGTASSDPVASYSSTYTRN